MKIPLNTILSISKDEVSNLTNDNCYECGDSYNSDGENISLICLKEYNREHVCSSCANKYVDLLIEERGGLTGIC